jgi:hypothetical protein
LVSSQDWLDTREIEYTENFTNTKSEIIDSNGIMKNFVDGNLAFTKNDTDRVSKQEMLINSNNYILTKTCLFYNSYLH